MIRSIRWCILIICIVPLQNYSAQIIVSDPSQIAQSFPFTVSGHAFHQMTQRFFVASNEAVANNTFTIAAAGSNDARFFGLTSAQVTLNNSPEQANPLFGAQINFLSLMGIGPVAVTAAQPAVVSFINNYTDLNNISILSAGPLLDAEKNSSAGIIGLASNAPDTAILGGSVVFAAVKNAAGNFGPVGSGIGGALYANVITGQDEEKNNIVKPFLIPLLANPLDITSSSIAINGDLTSIDNVANNEPVDLYWSPHLQLLYIGLLVTGGAGAGDGALSVTYLGSAQINSKDNPEDSDNTKTVGAITAIAPSTAITSDSIIGAISPSVQVSAHKVRTMLTTTALDYLIVVGGVGAPASTKREVFALPLVNDPNSVNFGQLASINAVPQTVFGAGRPFQFLARVISQPAEISGDLYAPTDIPAQVGGGTALPGDITDIFVVKDSVFVTVSQDPTTAQVAGIFYSQALFDDQGLIKGWTPWSPASGNTGAMFGLALDAVNGNFWFLPGSSSTTITTVQRTGWGSGFSEIPALVNNFLPQEQGGVQGLFDFPSTNVSFSQLVGERLSLLIATGFQKVIIMQSGQDVGGQFGPTTDFTPVFTNNTGSLAGFTVPAKVLQISGGVLESLGAIIAATIVTDGTYGWLVVGGRNGIAVLTHADGTGWTVGLESGFVGLDATMSFKLLGNYSQVRKLIFDNNFLYILSATQMDRVTVSPATFASSFNPTTVALRNLLPNSNHQRAFSDVVVSGDFSLLATNNGLWRVGDFASIATAGSVQEVAWTQVPLPEGPGPATRLFVISPTGNEQDVATTQNGGNIYVLASYIGYDQARVYRFTVTNSTPVTDSTLQLFPDYFVQNIQTFYFNVGSYRNYTVTDGALLFTSRSAYDPSLLPGTIPQNTPPFLQIASPLLTVGRRFIGQNSTTVLNIPNGKTMGQILRRSASGSWLVGGDFGVQVNE